MELTALHWAWPLAGGLLIGLSAAFYLLLAGRIAGISGLLASATGLARNSQRLAPALFVIGLVAGAWLAQGQLREADILVTGNLGLLLVGGVLVGYGSRLGSGCTSGHGVCGLARLSPRSLVATGVFMATAAITVFIVRHVVAAGVGT